MRSVRGKLLVLLCVLAGMPPGGFVWAQSSTGQGAPAQTAPKKKPSKPIDPDETGGVRGSGSLITVRVLMKGKTVENAHVVVKNINGTLASSCFTSATGDCQVDVGPDDYEFDATGNGRTGTLKLHVTAETRVVLIKLLKTPTMATSAKP